MQRFLIEREIDAAGKTRTSGTGPDRPNLHSAVASLGVPYTRVTSYVAGDEIGCLHETDYLATSLDHPRRRTSRPTSCPSWPTSSDPKRLSHPSLDEGSAEVRGGARAGDRPGTSRPDATQ